jgi:hypothetical protein
LPPIYSTLLNCSFWYATNTRISESVAELQRGQKPAIDDRHHPLAISAAALPPRMDSVEPAQKRVPKAIQEK